METISPIFINPTSTSITIGISKRFFLFQLIQTLTRRIEDDPFLNFVSVLKHYKVLGKFLSGDIYEFYRDRNKSYFKNFFIDKEIYKAVKSDLEWIYPQNQQLKMTITRWGVVVYDNYKPNSFNILLLTAHAGAVVPADIAKKQTMSKEERTILEDSDINMIYGNLVLEKNGIWIDNKLSRFACDYNRPRDKAIYKDHSEGWFEVLWKKPLTIKERKWLMESYSEFYFTLSHLIETYRFNLIFDGHSMKDGPDRAEISFGTKYIPKFYMPVVRSMHNKIKRLGYTEAAYNKPFSGGHILAWLHKKFPDVFIFSIELSKKLYMNKEGTKSIKKRIKTLADNINQIFDIEVDAEN